MGMQLMHATERMERAMSHRQERYGQRLSALADRLTGLNPMAVLSRGYSMTERDGSVISSIEALEAGQAVRIRMRDGVADATVTATQRVTRKS